MKLPPPDFLCKISAPSALEEKLAQLPRPLVMTNGVFDLLHAGHVTYLSQARTLGASLLVAINTDASTKRLNKGSDRPFNTLKDRAIMLAALGFIDCVTWFDENTPLSLIQRIKPDTLVKGGDYNMQNLPEGQWLQAHGGQALTIDLLPGYSTTKLANKIRQL